MRFDTELAESGLVFKEYKKLQNKTILLYCAVLNFSI